MPRIKTCAVDTGKLRFRLRFVQYVNDLTALSGSCHVFGGTALGDGHHATAYVRNQMDAKLSRCKLRETWSSV
jgi:hypothetical protein